MSRQPSSAGSTQFAHPSQTPAVQQSQAAATVPSEHAPVAVSERPVPTMGWPKFRYGLARLFRGDNTKVPALSKKERGLIEAREAAERQRQEQAQAEQARIKSFNDSVQALEDLTDETQSGTFVFINTKGAAAVTTTLVNTACTLGKYTQVISVVFDGNPAEGTSAARLGKNYNKTITVQQLHSRLDDLRTNFKSFIRQVRPNQYFVRCISANPVVQGDNPLLEPSQLDAILEVTQQNCEYLLIDTPNVINDEMGVTMIKRADVLVFTANVAVPDSLRRLGSSMQSLRNKGLSELVDNSVVVISNVKLDADIDQYKWYLNLVDIKDQLLEELAGQFHGSFIAVRHDPEIARDSIVNMDAWQPETDADYRNVVYHMLSRLKAAQFRKPAPAPQALPAAPEQDHTQNGHEPIAAVPFEHYQGGMSNES